MHSLEVRDDFSFRRIKTLPDLNNMGQMSYFIIGGTDVMVGQQSYFITGATNVVVGQMSYFIIGGTNVRWDKRRWDKCRWHLCWWDKSCATVICFQNYSLFVV